VFNKAFESLTIADISLLVENRIPEGPRLEFKRDHYGRKDADKREFAADVTAMANAKGGYILIGVDEDQGNAVAATGVSTDNADELILAVAQSLRSIIEPEIFGLGIRWLPILNNLGILLIHVPQSWSAPHAVTHENTCKFFLRDENGKHPMSVQEIKRSFSFAGEIESRVRSFRSARLELLRRNEGPLAIAEDKPKLVYHLLPLSAVTDPQQIQFEQHDSGISPFDASGYNSLYSLDGFVTYSGPEDIVKPVRAFTTLFRSGAVEAVGNIFPNISNNTPILDLTGIESSLILKTDQCFKELKKRGIANPLYVTVSILNVKDHAASARFDRNAMIFPYRATDLLLPELLIDHHNIELPVSNILRPLFDLLWNAFGLSQSVNFDASGNYVKT
jgi:Putative DNA-binding domain